MTTVASETDLLFLLLSPRALNNFTVQSLEGPRVGLEPTNNEKRLAVCQNKPLTLNGEPKALEGARKGLTLRKADAVLVVLLFMGSGDSGVSRWATALSKRRWGGIARAGCLQSI